MCHIKLPCKDITIARLAKPSLCYLEWCSFNVFMHWSLCAGASIRGKMCQYPPPPIHEAGKAITLKKCIGTPIIYTTQTKIGMDCEKPIKVNSVGPSDGSEPKSNKTPKEEEPQNERPKLRKLNLKFQIKSTGQFWWPGKLSWKSIWPSCI